MRYPRNLQGYGGNPPFADWPGGAPVAVSLVLNYEEGGENCILHGDAASEGFLSEIPGAAPWPGQRHWNMESVYEYGARAGFWRLRDLFVSRGVPVTVYGVASALARSPAQVAAMQEAGWEIASHGLRWIDYRNHDPEAEQADLDEAIRLHTEVTGEAPKRLVHRPHLGQHRRPRLRDRPLRLGRRHLRRRPPLLARAWREAAADHPLQPREQRHALLGGDLPQLRRLFHLPPRHLRRPPRRGRGRRAEDDVRRPPLPPRRPPRPHQGPRRLHRPREGHGAAGSPPAPTSPPTGAPATRPRRSPTARRRSPRTPSSPASDRSTSTRPGSPSAPTPSSSARPTTPRSASPTPWPAPSARPPRTSASASSPPTPTSPASSPPPSA